LQARQEENHIITCPPPNCGQDHHRHHKVFGVEPVYGLQTEQDHKLVKQAEFVIIDEVENNGHDYAANKNGAEKSHPEKVSALYQFIVKQYGKQECKRQLDKERTRGKIGGIDDGLPEKGIAHERRKIPNSHKDLALEPAGLEQADIYRIEKGIGQKDQVYDKKGRNK
jgi:hypothetical protein